MKLRQEIKATLDKLPDERLPSLADYVKFLARRPINLPAAAADKATGIVPAANSGNSTRAGVSSNRSKSPRCSRPIEDLVKELSPVAYEGHRDLVKDRRIGKEIW